MNTPSQEQPTKKARAGWLEACQAALANDDVDPSLADLRELQNRWDEAEWEW